MFDHRWSIGDQGSFDVCRLMYVTSVTGPGGICTKMTELRADGLCSSHSYGRRSSQHAGTEEQPPVQKALLEQTTTGAGPWRPGLAQGRRPESSLNRYEFAEMAAQADTEHPEALRRINAS